MKNRVAYKKCVIYRLNAHLSILYLFIKHWLLVVMEEESSQNPLLHGVLVQPKQNISDELVINLPFYKVASLASVLFACKSFYLSVRLSVFLFVCTFVCLFVCLSVC